MAVPNNTSYYFFDTQYKSPVVVFQEGKVVIDRELIQSQVGNIVTNWQENVATFGEERVSRSCVPSVVSNNLSIPACKLIAEDGIIVDIDEPVTVSAGALGAGTYYVVATIQCDVKDSTDDADVRETAYGADTIMMMELKTTFSLQASTLSSRVQDTSLSSGGTEGSGGAVRHLIVSTSLYTSNRFKYGNVKDSNGTRYKIIEQRDNTPGIGQTTFVCDKGPNQSAPTLTGGVGGYLIYPYPFYQPVSSYAVRYIVLGTVTINGSFQITGYTHTAPYFDTASELIDLFDVEHNDVTGAHGPNVTINNTTNTVNLDITKSHTGNANVINITNSGSGKDIDADNWDIQKDGTANVKGLVVSSNSGYGISITNAGPTNALYIDNTTSYNAIYVKNWGSSSALVIDQSSGSQSVVINLGIAGSGLYISKTNTAGGSPISIVNAGTGQGINVTQQGAGIGLQVTQQAALQGIYINKSNTTGGSPLDIVNAGIGNSINITQNGNGVGLVITKTNTGNANIVDLTNAGSGYDIDGNASNWYVDKSGNAVFNSVNTLPFPNTAVGALEAPSALTNAYVDKASVTVTIPTGAEAVVEVFTIATVADVLGTPDTPTFKVLRGATPLWENVLANTIGIHGVSRCYFDTTPGTGSVTFKVQAKSGGMGTTLTGTHIKVTLI